MAISEVTVVNAILIQKAEVKERETIYTICVPVEYEDAFSIAFANMKEDIYSGSNTT